MAADVNGKMLKMLDRLHLAMDNETLIAPKMARHEFDDLFNEIGCLIAEAKGEYEPTADTDGMDAQDHHNRGPM